MHAVESLQLLGSSHTCLLTLLLPLSFHRLPNPKSENVKQSNQQTNESVEDCAVFIQEQPLDEDVESHFELSTENRDATDFPEMPIHKRTLI